MEKNSVLFTKSFSYGSAIFFVRYGSNNSKFKLLFACQSFEFWIFSSFTFCLSSLFWSIFFCSFFYLFWNSSTTSSEVGTGPCIQGWDWTSDIEGLWFGSSCNIQVIRFLNSWEKNLSLFGLFWQWYFQKVSDLFNAR